MVRKLYLKRNYYIWLFIGAVILSYMPYTVLAAESGKPVQRQIVKIYVQNQEDINELAGIAEPWEVHKDYIIIDVTEAEIQQIRKKGFSVEVLFESIRDLVNYYGVPQPHAGTEGLYHSYAELKNDFLQLQSAYPQIARVYDIGDSWEKTQGMADRDILAIKISDNVAQEEDEAEILFIGEHHAREWISVEVPFYLAKYLVENYNTDPVVRSYVDNGEIWIVPMVNPDGHQYSIDVDRMWRKNRRNNGDGSYGVDMNRNYSYMWGGPGSSGNSWSEIYRGPFAFSEPETQAVRNLALTHNFQAMLTYHSYGQLILYPWGYTYSPAPDKQLLSYMTTHMADLIKGVNGKIYTPQQSSDLYISSGTTDDWFYGELGIFGFTIELRPEGYYPGFILPETEIIPTWEENKPAALYLIQWSQLPADPLPDIKANDLDGPVTITQGSTISLKVNLNAGRQKGMYADWWALANTPFGWYRYNLTTNSWQPGMSVTYQGTLFNLAPYEILNISGLPVGAYAFYSGVDMNMNGLIDIGKIYYDRVGVNITPYIWPEITRNMMLKSSHFPTH
ncbi:MAG: hypothetical protein A2W23_08115 [Planctomycetes bacterium RBG_16_43_13]|nr:MAG: hypothetical protein A2W23_08115 [Planctomycetes bacterium RBG_16_43_13]